MDVPLSESGSTDHLLMNCIIEKSALIQGFANVIVEEYFKVKVAVIDREFKSQRLFAFNCLLEFCHI